MSLGLSGITTANLTDTGGRQYLHRQHGWTGSGTLKGTSETLVDSVSASVALSQDLAGRDRTARR